ncbi:transposase [Streptomyces rimosus]|uniref:transposase n=1 Tax=Streptomyces rimosus TaxID=1927 RepID=UPI00373AF578
MPRRDRRQVIDAIACKSRTGSQWVHLPERYGNRRGVHIPAADAGRHRSIPRQTDHRDPSGGRRPLLASGLSPMIQPQTA